MSHDYFELLKEEIKQFEETVDLNAIESAVELICSNMETNRVHLTGIGKPSYVAKYAASLYSSTGISAYFLDGTEAVHGSVGQVHPGDVVIVISNSGETEELKHTVNALKQKGAHLIALTGNSESSISRSSDISLVAHANNEGGLLNKAPKISIILEILMIQLLNLSLQSRIGLTPEEYLINHPSGNLGKQIKMEIEKS